MAVIRLACAGTISNKAMAKNICHTRKNVSIEALVHLLKHNASDARLVANEGGGPGTAAQYFEKEQDRHEGQASSAE